MSHVQSSEQQDSLMEKCRSDRSKWINQTKPLTVLGKKIKGAGEDRMIVHGYLWYILQCAILNSTVQYASYSLIYHRLFSNTNLYVYHSISQHSDLFLFCPSHCWGEMEQEGFQQVIAYRNYLVQTGSSRLITTTLRYKEIVTVSTV